MLFALRQTYTSGELLTGNLKKELIDILHRIVAEHQERRELVTDDVVMQYMAPRPLTLPSRCSHHSSIACRIHVVKHIYLLAFRLLAALWLYDLSNASLKNIDSESKQSKNHVIKVQPNDRFLRFTLWSVLKAIIFNCMFSLLWLSLMLVLYGTLSVFSFHDGQSLARIRYIKYKSWLLFKLFLCLSWWRPSWRTFESW